MNNDCTQVFKLADKHGTIIHNEEEEGSMASEDRPEIARNNLNQLLYEQLPPSAVQWEQKLIYAKWKNEKSKTGIELNFGSSRGKETFDLVIGADGAWSKIRSLVTDIKPKFAHQHFITMSIRSITSKYPHLARLVGSGSFTALGEKHGIVSQRAANDTARIYTLIHTTDEKWAARHGVSGMTAAQVKPILLEGDAAPLRSFGPLLKELISVACDDETATDPHALVENRPLYTLYETPEGHPWENQPGVTLLGDAAHLMPPNGEGVNMAMQDALHLTEAIVASKEKAEKDCIPVKEALIPMLQNYERDMFVRAKNTALETEKLLGAMYGSDNGAQDILRMFKEMFAYGETPDATHKPIDN